jgi:hypothetical protein
MAAGVVRKGYRLDDLNATWVPLAGHHLEARRHKG